MPQIHAATDVRDKRAETDILAPTDNAEQKRDEAEFQAANTDTRLSHEAVFAARARADTKSRQKFFDLAGKVHLDRGAVAEFRETSMV